jgi:Domain of unknown function (DUF5916)/Carbohydrate family 9 binding domain-like
LPTEDGATGRAWLRVAHFAAAGLVVSLGASAIPARAAASPPSEKRRFRATRVTAAPVIDGILDDRCWASGAWQGGFTQREPYEGERPTEETDFQIGFDDESLYVAIRAHDREPSLITSRVTRRDDRQGDQVEIYFDSYFDHQTAFAFNVNSAGVKTDFVLSRDGADEDDTWDAVWHARVAVGGEGWTAEIAIPFSQLRFGGARPRVWGLQVRRRLHRKEELSDWQLVPKEASGFVHGFGELDGLDDVPPHRQTELVPYAVTKMERYDRESGNPFSTGSSENLAVGLDGKVAATSDLTLTFTVNPDFGQVEADPSEVNLTTYETFFSEKRPFFVEGANILDFGMSGGDGPFARDNLFYSRRIGRPPQRDLGLGDDEYYDAPANTTILGALKLTGKTRTGWSIGLLDGVTSSEHATVDTFGERRREVVEPFANYLVTRVQKDFDEGNRIVGGIFTATDRNRESADVSLLHREAYTGGLDFRQGFRDRTYYLNARMVFSDVRGNTATLLETQEAPQRYFQRPDATYLAVDPTRTSLAGHGGTVEIGKEGGGRLRFSTGATWRSPGLELNDVGFLRAADQIMQWSWVGWRIWKPFAVFRNVNINANQWRGWDFGGSTLFAGGNVNVNADLRNYWSFGTGINRDGPSISNSELRGGPSLRQPGGWSQWLNLRSDSRRNLRFNVGGWRYRSDGNVDELSGIWVGATLRPTAAASISLEPTLNRQRRTLQYVDTVDGGYGDRYVMGSLEQTTLGLTVRLSYSVTPDLSIQYYGQPFVSTGAYTQFKRITQPRAEIYDDRFELYSPEQITFDASANEYVVDETGDGGGSYRFSNPDFDFRQLRSNLVLRWEYTPGSTLFVVWSQDRTGDEATGGLSLREGLRELYRIAPYNIFLVKFSYRFAL